MAKKKESRLEQANNKIKKMKVTKDDKLYIGIDVHKQTNHVAIWKNSSLGTHWVASNNLDSLIASLLPIRENIVCIAYEAGPTGYGLWRKLKNAGFPAIVVAPNCIVKSARPTAKTDKIDCIHLAERASKNDLKGIIPPSEQEEQIRSIARLRGKMVKKRASLKSAIKSFLLSNGLPVPLGLSKWTLGAISALKEMELPESLRFELDELLLLLEEFTCKVKRIDGKLAEMVKNENYAKKFAIVTSHPGVGTVVGTRFITEIYQPERFKSGESIACYLGLAPRIRQSGETTKLGGVIPSGQKELRSLLVEAAWQWIRYDKAAKARWSALLARVGNSQKAIIAMARRLAVNLWTMLVKGQYYRKTA